MYSYFIDVP